MSDPYEPRIQAEEGADALAEARGSAGERPREVAVGGALSGEMLTGQPLGLWADTWRRLKRNKLAVIGLGIIIVFVALGLVEVVFNLTGWHGGYFAPYNPNAVNYALSPTATASPPTWAHPFGTD